MITLTSTTVEGRCGATLAETDAEVLAVAALFGWPGSDAWYAAEFLRSVYWVTLATAGSVDLVASTVMTVAA